MLKYFFPWLKLKTPNLKWHKKLFIYIESYIAIIMIAWTLWVFVGIKYIFSHEYTYGNTHFYAPNQLSKSEGEKLGQVVSHTKSILKKVNIDIDRINAKVFIEKGDIFFKLSLIPGTQLFPTGSAMTLGNYTFLPNANIDKKLFMHQSGSSESLELTLAHELTHVWQNQTYPTWRYMSFLTRNAWYMEGYPVYITNDPIMHDPKIVKDALANAKHVKRSQKEAYALWGLMVKHAIEKMHKSVDDLHLGKVDYDEVLDSLLREYNITK